MTVRPYLKMYELVTAVACHAALARVHLVRDDSSLTSARPGTNMSMESLVNIMPDMVAVKCRITARYGMK